MVRSILLLSGLSKQLVIAATIEAGLIKLREATGAMTPSREKLRDAVNTLCSAMSTTPVDLAG